jgi:hypothetical protein
VSGARLWMAAGLVAAALAAPVGAQDDPRLQQAREHLEALRFEEALAAVEGVLEVEAWVIRAQAHVATGDHAAAERDFREILARAPGWTPDPALTPPKAMARFQGVRASLVGTVILSVQPADAAITVDGSPVSVSTDGRLALLAGLHALAAERDGFDPERASIDVPAGLEVPLALQLTPNARTVVVRTSLDGVRVSLDGAEVGATSGGELVLPNLPLGEHVFVLGAPCRREVRLDELLSVDLLDQAPRILGPIELEPAKGRLTLSGLGGADLSVDGQRAGVVSTEPVEACAGTRAVSVSRGGRVLWAATVEVPDGDGVAVEIDWRPNLVPVAGESEAIWRSRAAAWLEGWNVREPVRAPDGADLAEPAAWEGLPLPPDTDLALAWSEARSEGGPGWLLYSPHLRAVSRVSDLPPSSRPGWRARSAGWRLADSRGHGAARVVLVAPGGPAESAGIRVGERIVAVGGIGCGSAGAAAEALASASLGPGVTVRVASSTGTERDVTLVPREGPVLAATMSETPDAMAVRAAWAGAAAEASPPTVPVARTTLALLLSAAGRHDAAAAMLERVTWPARAGVGAGTRAYLLGRELEAMGREEAARAAFEEARASTATAPHDEGTPVAPAAADRLADLGVPTP